jgi:uncharacterized protein (DUF433 family)
MALTIGGDLASVTIDSDGVARVGGTRVTLDTVVWAFEQGATPDEIALRCDTLQLADIYAAIDYYLKHRAEVDDYLAKRRLEAVRVRRDPGQKSDRQTIRDRLRARAVHDHPS